MKKGVAFFTFAFVFALAYGHGAYGYDNVLVHPRFARQATQLYNQTVATPLTPDQASWIVAGAVKEDADPRYLNHFYDYRTGKGFSIGMPANLWSQYQFSESGDFSENAILDAYQKGNEQLAYVGVGHQLHIIEDMAVPAHVRNDPHDPDPYEDWCQKNIPNLPAANLIEVNNLSGAIVDLAKFTGSKFFSKDDVKTYENSDHVVKFDDGLFYLVNNNKNKVLWAKPVVGGYVYSFSDEVRKDYFIQLAPKAIGYSAGVIDYFQKKFAAIDKENKEKGKLSLLAGAAYDSIADTFADFSIMFGDTVNQVAMALQINGNQVVRKEVADNPQLREDLQAANQPSDQGLASTIDKAVVKTSTSIIKALEKTKVLGEKIAAAVPQATGPVVQADVRLKASSKEASRTDQSGTTAKASSKTSSLNPFAESDKTKADNDEIIFNIIRPANAETVIDPRFSTPIRTSPIPIFDFPANDEPFDVPEPKIYPETLITTQPPMISSSSRANFEFSSDQIGSVYEYAQEAVSSTTIWQPAGPILELKDLSDGRQVFSVRAIYNDNADLTPAEYSWVIDTVAPSSQFAELDKYYNQSSFPISWSRTDSGTDEAYFNIDFATTSGEWVSYEHATTATSTLFLGGVQSGETVGFRVQACDVLGNCEPLATSSQAATRVGPVIPATTTLSLVSATGQSAIVTWNTPNDANLELATTAQYELKYQVKNGSCNLAANWETASSTTGLPTPQLSAGGAESFTLTNLAAGTTYCAAIRTNNGANWSELSNVLEFRTNCNDTLPRAMNYTTHLSKASTSSVPNQTPESILVVDYTNHIINYVYRGMIMVDFGVYSIFGSNTCGQIAERAIGFNDPASTMTRIELVYDPETKLFTGQYRQCENGWHYLMQFDGDRCRDLANGWASRRWYTNPNLQGQSMISLLRTRTGQFTDWLKIP